MWHIQWCRCHALYNPYSFKYYSLICIWYMHEFDAIDFQTKQDWNWFLTNFFMVCSTKALLTYTISTQCKDCGNWKGFRNRHLMKRKIERQIEFKIILNYNTCTIGLKKTYKNEKTYPIWDQKGQSLKKSRHWIRCSWY